MACWVSSARGILLALKLNGQQLQYPVLEYRLGLLSSRSRLKTCLDSSVLVRPKRFSGCTTGTYPAYCGNTERFFSAGV